MNGTKMNDKILPLCAAISVPSVRGWVGFKPRALETAGRPAKLAMKVRGPPPDLIHGLIGDPIY